MGKQNKSEKTEKQKAMTADDYQQATKSFAVYPPAYAMEYLVLGLVSEAGEVAGKLSKLIRGDYTKYNEDNPEEYTIDIDEFHRHLELELGDTLWMISQICNEAGLTMGGVMKSNIAKLEARKNANTIRGNGDDR